MIIEVVCKQFFRVTARYIMKKRHCKVIIKKSLDQFSSGLEETACLTDKCSLHKLHKTYIQKGATSGHIKVTNQIEIIDKEYIIYPFIIENVYRLARRFCNE